MTHKRQQSFKYSFFALFILLTISACTQVAVKPVTQYQLTEKAYLYELKTWSFSGRLGLSNPKESWSASIDWQHDVNQDIVKLAGPLGQGAVVITLTDNKVVVDNGDKKITQTEYINEFIQQQLGVFVPVKALRYWVLGLTEPKTDYKLQEKGFLQAQWQVLYSQMQQTQDQHWMPRKLTAKQQQTKLKLIIDEWTL